MDALVKIEGYKTLLTQVTIAQNTQFHRDATGQIALIVPQVDGIVPAFEIYRSDANMLDMEFDKKTKSIETEELSLKDERRDAITTQIISRIDYHSKFPANEAEKESIHVLKFIADSYRESPQKNYQAETSYLRNMVAELRKNNSGLELFGLTPLVNSLDKENTEFETLHNVRTNAKEAKRERGTLKTLVKTANYSFDIFCQISNGMLLMPLDDASKSALEQIVSIINALIHQYTIIYHRHAGTVASKKKATDKPDEE